jgi:hypothetical protein
MTVGSWTAGDTFPGENKTFGSYKTWDGGDGRSWGDGLPHRGPPWHPYAMTHRIWRNPEGAKRIYFVRPNDHDDYTGGLYPPGVDYTNYSFPQTSLVPLSNWSSLDELALLAKLIEKVKNHDFHIGVSLAEVDKLSSSVVTSIGRITRGAWELSRGNVAGAFRAWGTTERKTKQALGRGLKVKDISGSFLELSYGWTPTVQDAFSAAKAFEEISKGPRGVTFKVSKRRIWLTSSSPQGIVIQRFRNEIRRGYIYEQSEELSALRSIGLVDPLSILWERIPWSFVIDWFAPIGSYLELIGQVPYLKGRFLRTTASKQTYLGWLPDPNGFPPYKVPRYTDETYVLSREVLSSPPYVPFPTVRVAGAIHGRRVWNAIALAHQIFDKMIGIRTPGRPTLRQTAKDKSDFSWPFETNFDR